MAYVTKAPITVTIHKNSAVVMMVTVRVIIFSHPKITHAVRVSSTGIALTPNIGIVKLCF